MILEHYGPEALVFDRSRTYEQRVHFKPRGFWVSVKGEYDWPEWAESEDFGWPESFKHRYEVTVSETANILTLGTVAAIREFHEKYFLPAEFRYGNHIDWTRVAEDYDGIIIAPYQWTIRTDEEMFWYYSWDVASGCIWNLDVIDIEWKEQDWIERRDRA